MRLQLGRLGVLLVAAVTAAGACGAAVVAVCLVVGIQLPPGRTALAVGLQIPVALAVGALGLAMLPRLNRVAVGVLAALVIEGFIVQVIGAVAGFPQWLRDLSLMQAYGSPLSHGLNRGGLALLMAIFALGLAATLAQTRAEVSTG